MKGKETKVVVIGAGSADFGPAIIADLLQEPALKGSEICLVDIDPDALGLVKVLVERMNTEWKAGCRISAETDRRKPLIGASFVIVSIAIEREKRWRMDWEIPLKFGIRQPLGENGGPAGLIHGARSIPPFLDICRDVERLCPKAFVLNFTNPVPRVTLAGRRYTRARVIGLCHQLFRGIGNISRWLKRPPESMRITAAGLNHFSWFLEIHDRKTGKSLYPELIRILRKLPADDQPLSREIFDIFGLFPIPGDSHLSEYLPWCHDPLTKPWKRYKLPLYPWAKMERRRVSLRRRFARLASGKGSINSFKKFSGERAAPFIASVLKNNGSLELAIDIPNKGYIENLPDGAIVEVPSRVWASGPEGVCVGALPKGIASLCRRQIEIADLAVDAAVLGNRPLALRALVLDPTVNDLTSARQMLDALLKAHKDLLPQFRKKKDPG